MATNHASAMAKLRWKKSTPEERKEWGKQSAQKRWSNTTPEERKAYSQKMIEARRKKKTGDN